MISAISSVKNVLDSSYPFAESVLSIIPTVEKLYIHDGGSDDGTVGLLNQIKYEYDNVELILDKDFENPEELISVPNTEWVLQVKPYEVWHEDCYMGIPSAIQGAEGYNAIRHPVIQVEAVSGRWKVRRKDKGPVRIVRRERVLEGSLSPVYESRVPLYDFSKTFRGVR